MQVFEHLGRSRRDRGAELLDDLLARVAGTRTAAKYDSMLPISRKLAENHFRSSATLSAITGS
jgi:hypothetical protein